LRSRARKFYSKGFSGTLRGCSERLVFKGVLIDFGGTLAYLDEIKFGEYEAELVATLRKYGYERRLKDLSAVLASIYWDSSKGELKSAQEFWGQMLRKLRIPERLEVTDALQAVGNDHVTAMWKLYDEVFETLTILQEKYKLAMVSNCAVGTDRIIRSLGLADFFGCIILSYQVGVRKPDKRIYLEALRCLGLEANECVFVADEISDLEGARETGLKTILVLQGHSTFQEAKDLNFKPDFQINEISEVTSVV
jgi:HAD superfamily hydrolase (TIGR01509 family)